VSTTTQVEISTSGGTFTEGIVGTPRFVNPVLAVTRADKDMSNLIYDGIMQLGSDGTLVPNIAESITISDDGLTYNIVLKQQVRFHDDTPLTADDIVFTIGQIQEPALASPLRASFEDVTIEQLSEYEINFVLPEPYTPFIENLTFGILPRHIWKDATIEEFPFSQHNSEPIGSGPYKIAKILRNTSGIPESYVLVPHTEHHDEVAKIDVLQLHFYTNEDTMIDAFNEGDLMSIAGIHHGRLSDLTLDPAHHTIITTPLPRTYALFFNQNKSAALRERSARAALNAAIDREALIDTVLGGYGTALTTPIPPGFGVAIAPTPETSTTTETALNHARGILRESGWKLNEETGVWEKTIDDIVTPLAFSITTVNSPIFEHTAEYLRTEWTKLGAAVTVKQFEQSDLTQTVIRPRDYETLLFGTALGRSLDFYSFWHSSQRNDPGLNVSLYANITTDSILSEARTNADKAARHAALTKFAAELEEEIPAVFLYSPAFLYVFPTYVTGASFDGLEKLSERFASIPHWYINTDSVWSLFSTDTD